MTKKIIIGMVLTVVLALLIILLHYIPVKSSSRDYLGDCSPRPSKLNYRILSGELDEYNRVVSGPDETDYPETLSENVSYINELCIPFQDYDSSKKIKLFVL